MQQLTWAFGTFASGPLRTNGGLNYPWSLAFVAVMFVGYAALWKQRKDAALILILPMMVALAASSLNVYRVTGRLLVFLEPGLLLATAAGARHLLLNLPHGLQFTAPAILGVLVGSPIYAAATPCPPIGSSTRGRSSSSLADRFEPNDAVYMIYGAAQAFLSSPHGSTSRCATRRSADVRWHGRARISNDRSLSRSTAGLDAGDAFEPMDEGPRAINGVFERDRSPHVVDRRSGHSRHPGARGASVSI